jgi:hypothetical protein|tara:strand:- start:616 stop:1158 length:543 start_codon:yes stop_codon:yes gene_type:complete
VIRILSILIIVSSFFGCKNTKPVSEGKSAETQQPEEVVISTPDNTPFVILPLVYPENSIVGIKRTSCFGTCPVYTMFLLDDFTLVYKGKRNVDKLGDYSAQASKEEYDLLIAFADEIGYFGFEDQYVTDVSDIPTVYTTLVKKGKRKTVVNLFMGPEQLSELESYIDAVFKDKDWVKVED